MEIPAVTLHQPWATLVAHGHKKIETRSWRCPLEVPCVLAIHAGTRWTRELYHICLQTPFREALEAAGVLFPPPGRRGVPRPTIPFGEVVALARLVECIRTDDLDLRADVPPQENVVVTLGGLVEPAQHEVWFGDYSPGRWAWVFDKVRRLTPPIGYKGLQGVWKWQAPEEFREVVEEMLR